MLMWSTIESLCAFTEQMPGEIGHPPYSMSHFYPMREKVLLHDGFTEELPCALEIGEHHRVIGSWCCWHMYRVGSFLWQLIYSLNFCNLPQLCNVRFGPRQL